MLKKEKECKRCSKLFTPVRSTAEYCGGTCRKLYNKNKSKSGDANTLKSTESPNPAVAGSYLAIGDAKKSSPANSSQRACEYCNKPLKKSNKRWCNRVCQTGTTDNRLLENYYRSPFLNWWLAQFKRSWCLGVLHNPDGTKQSANDIEKLHEVYELCRKANGFGADKIKEYEMCHLFPNLVDAGDGWRCIGLLHHLNFVVAPEQLNKELGNKDFGFPNGVSKVFKILRPDSVKGYNLAQLIDNYLGGALHDFIRNHESLVARRYKSKTPYNKPPKMWEDVLFRESKRLNLDIEWGCLDISIGVIDSHKEYYNILTNGNGDKYTKRFESPLAVGYVERTLSGMTIEEYKSQEFQSHKERMAKYHRKLEQDRLLIEDSMPF